MQTYGQTTTGAQTLKFDIPGKYFVLLATNLGVNIRFYKLGKKLDLGDISNLMAGVEATLGQPDDSEPAFTRVEIDTLGADTIQFGIGNGQVRYNRSQGNVQVTSGLITINNPRANPVWVDQAPSNFGASYKSVVTMAANTPETIFTPAANVNGAIVHKAEFTSGNGSSLAPLAAILSKASAPVSIIDGDVIVGSSAVGSAGTNWWTNGKLEKPIFIQAGKGLYFIANTAESAAFSARNALFTLL